MVEHHTHPIVRGGSLSYDAELTEYLGGFLSEPRKAAIERVLTNRTRYLTVVLEDIVQSQNASAVVRTCECLGIQDIHIIENESRYSVNKKVLKGSNKWLDLHRYKWPEMNNTATCFRQLREVGYQLVVTDPSPGLLPVQEADISKPVAIVMGNELNGASAYALAQADQKVNIPMFGFTESLNISVSAAICLQTLITKIRSSAVRWQLSETEKNFLRQQWYRKSVRRVELIEKEFLESQQRKPPGR